MESSLKTQNRRRSWFRTLYAPAFERQTYRNLVYLLLALPAGIFYTSVLLSAVSTGLGLTFILVGFPILFGVLIAGIAFGQIERFLANRLLKTNISAESSPAFRHIPIRDRILGTLRHSLTWKSIVFLFAKLPLGFASLMGLFGAAATTLGLLFAPLAYIFTGGSSVASFGPIEFGSLPGSFFAMAVGFVMLPLFLRMMNAWAWINGQVATFMLNSRDVAVSRDIAEKMNVIESGEQYIDPLEQIDTLKEEEKSKLDW